MSSKVSTRVLIWDLPTRVFHWVLAFSFFGAYLLAESERMRHIHVMFGYTVFALTMFRLLWGFIGSRYARFSSFAFGPRAVFDHVRGLATRSGPEHAGHTPAGSWAIWLMLALALITAASGYLYYNEVGGEAMEEVHEAAANAWLFVVFVHVAGVIVSSLVERRNLVLAMVTGYKTLARAPEKVRSASMLGVLMLTGVAAFWAVSVLSGGAFTGPSESTAAAADRSLSSHVDSDDD